MGQAIGLVTAALQLGVNAILVKPKRSIGPFTAHVTLRETHTDELEITEQPVELGAQITDHVFKRPAEVVIECAWSNSPQTAGIFGGAAAVVTGTIGGVQSILTGNSLDQVRDIYQKLLALQASGDRFDVYTGKRVYKDMLLKQLVVRTDRENENSLAVTATLKQIIVVQTQIVTIGAPKEAQASPESTMPEVNKGNQQLSEATNYNEDAGAAALQPDDPGRSEERR